MEEDHLTLNKAMDKFYTSVAFEKLSDPETGLYLESPYYLMELFRANNYLH